MVKVIWHKTASPPRTDRSLVLARWRQCAPTLVYSSLGPHEFASKTEFRSVHPFLRGSTKKCHDTGYRSISVFITLASNIYRNGSSLPKIVVGGAGDNAIPTERYDKRENYKTMLTSCFSEFVIVRADHFIGYQQVHFSRV